MLGLFANSTGKIPVAMEYYSRIIEVLQWGAHTWRDVPMEDRGVIFEKTFIRGAKRLKLTAMHAVSLDYSCRANSYHLLYLHSQVCRWKRNRSGRYERRTRRFRPRYYCRNGCKSLFRHPHRIRLRVYSLLLDVSKRRSSVVRL